MTRQTHIAQRVIKAVGNDPFLLPSTLIFPRDLKGSFDLALYLVKSNRMFLSVMRRLFTYFVTRLKVETEHHGADEQIKIRRVLERKVRIVYLMHQVADNWATYGNAFIAKFPPFTRWLVDETSQRAVALDRIPSDLVKYDAEKLIYEIPDVFSIGTIPDTRGGFKGLRRKRYEFRDKVSNDVDLYYFKMLDPRYVDIDKPHHAKSKAIIYQVPADAEARIREGILGEVNTTPRVLLEAVAEGKDYKFRQDEVFHFRGPQPEGITDSDWACPEVLLCFDIIYQIMVYRKSDIAVAEEFMTPARMISPASPEVANSGLLDDFMYTVQKMLEARRTDPKVVFASPIPAQMNEFSGNGRAMVAHDIIDAHMELFFDAVGMPREFFRGSLMLEQTPAMARMFQQQFGWLTTELNGLAQFIADAVLPMEKYNNVTVSWSAPSIANTAEAQQMIAQQVAMRELPRRELADVNGVEDPQMARREAIREDFEMQEMQAEEGMKFERRQQTGSMADMAMMAAEQGAQQQMQGGGVPPTPDGMPDIQPNPSDTPDIVMQRAAELARFWLQLHAQQPNSHRSHMQQTEATHPSLHAQAVQAMKKERAAAESAGRAQVGMM